MRIKKTQHTKRLASSYLLDAPQLIAYSAKYSEDSSELFLKDSLSDGVSLSTFDHPSKPLSHVVELLVHKEKWRRRRRWLPSKESE